MSANSHDSVNPTPLPRLIADLAGAEMMAYSRRADISMLTSAVWYVEKLGWPVFPLVARGKKPLVTGPFLHGFKTATLDAQAVRDTWRRHPDANIGIPTGPTSSGGCGYDVIDVDGATGRATFAALGADAIPPVHGIAFTPGDPTKDNGEPGRHLYIDATGDGNATRFQPGLDYRGLGGYVVAAPSMALHGVRYCWLNRPAQ